MSAPDLHPADGGPAAMAGEYVLGVLDAEERAAFARRLAGDPTMRREVEAWEARLTPWAEGLAPLDPPATLWASIERAMGPATAAANDDGVVVVLKRRLANWRAATAVSLALAAALAVVAVLPVVNRAPAPGAPPPMMVASLTPAGGHAAMFMATFDPARRELMIAPSAHEDRPGHAPELWLIPKGGKPVPLGMAGFGAPVRLVMASDMGGAGRTTLAVSLEPPGGSPTGQPTGPVIATGELRPV